MVNKIFWGGLTFNIVLVFIVIRHPATWIEVVVGAILSIWITLLIEVIRKPELEIQLYRDGQPIRFKAGRYQGYVLQLRLINKPLNHYLATVLQRDAAIDTSGTITFRELGTEKEIAPAMPIRWSNSPQPWHQVIEVTESQRQAKTIYDPDRFAVVQRIPPGDSDAGVLDVAARFDNETDCYGVSNESYGTDWHPQKWKLPPGEYIVDVIVNASNGYRRRRFRLINGNELPRDFRLEEYRAKGVLV